MILGEANPGFHLLRTPPPGRFPEWLVKDLFSRVPAPLHGQVVHFPQAALQVQDAGKKAGLVEECLELGGGRQMIPQQRCLPGAERSDLRDITVDLEHGVGAEQLHPAVDNDFIAILADMAQFAGPVTLAAQLRLQLGKVDGEFGLQQRVAAASDRLLR